MSDQNSVVVPQIRPEQAMEQLGLKRDAYYSDLKFLGIKAQKDSEGKSFLEAHEFQLLAALRNHVEETGKRDGFQMPGELATTATDEMTAPTPEAIPVEPSQEEPQFDMAALMEEAQELAGSRMTMKEQIVNAIASQMTFEDLSPEVQTKVQNVRAAVDPKKAQPQKIAVTLLDQWRQQRAMAAA